MPVINTWIGALSDGALWLVAIFVAMGHWLGWFVFSPYPVQIGAAAAALLGPFLLALRISDQWHRRRLSKFLADQEELKLVQSRGTMIDVELDC